MLLSPQGNESLYWWISLPFNDRSQQSFISNSADTHSQLPANILAWTNLLQTEELESYSAFSQA